LAQNEYTQLQTANGQEEENAFLEVSRKTKQNKTKTFVPGPSLKQTMPAGVYF
jgi:hypothetical protein